MSALPTVLVVDDEPFIGRVVRLVLEDAELARVVVARTAAELWQYLETELPALILLDILLPDAHGLAILEQLRDNPRFRSIPVVVMSHITDMQTLREALSISDGVLTKPVSARELVRCVERILRNA